jgi:uncharacterized protein (TIGR00725 family)
MRTVIGVMGGAVASDSVTANAYEVGRLVAEQGWVLLNGGRNAGVMAASAMGASEAGGLVVGVLPGESPASASPFVDIAIPTGMGDARNIINVLASDVVIALPGGAGTISEVALALKSGKTVIALDFALGTAFDAYYAKGRLIDAATPHEAVLLASQSVVKDVP